MQYDPKFYSDFGFCGHLVQQQSLYELGLETKFRGWMLVENAEGLLKPCKLKI